MSAIAVSVYVYGRVSVYFGMSGFIPAGVYEAPHVCLCIYVYVCVCVCLCVEKCVCVCVWLSPSGVTMQLGNVQDSTCLASDAVMSPFGSVLCNHLNVDFIFFFHSKT